MSKGKTQSAESTYASTRLKVKTESDLERLEYLVTEVVRYRHFKVSRTEGGHTQYFLGDGVIKSRKRGKCSRSRQPFVKAHTAIWFLTDELAQKALAIIERNLDRTIG